ncbi:MAG: D-alanyl-D-alanine carboxypeptidase [Myxococcaceae bacterium]|nr:D-alanyl-D-alanine carboxypeptidase [Myxococcaceae bacterium]MEA2746528.1 hypothetical protein [Myxococcales bacterium]
MHRKDLLPLARLFAVVSVMSLGLAGCASSDGTTTDTAPAADDITPQEVSAGEAAGPAAAADDGSAAADLADGTTDVAAESELTITTPAEDATPFLDPEELALRDPSAAVTTVDPDSLNQTQSCHRVSGYRSGHKMNICVTTIDGKYVEVNTARAYLRMRKAARKVGVSMYVVSGFRSMAQQRYLYHCYLSKKCNGGNLAAVPGYSNHQSGHALDLNTSAGGVYSYLVNHGHSYGFRRTVPSEKWHWEH